MTPLDDSALAKHTIRKITWRLLPVLMLGYFIAFVDRVNVGFAALQMNHDIGLSAAVGLAQVNAIGNLAGFVGSWMLGLIKEHTGSFALALLPIAVISGVGCVILWVMTKKSNAS